MCRKFIMVTAVAAFLLVELVAVQPSEAQRLRNLLRRNNGCDNCCQGCGVTTESNVIVESPAIATDGYVVPSSGASSYEGEIYSSPVVSTPMIESPIIDASPVMTESFAQSIVQSQSIAQPYIETQQPYIETQPSFIPESVVQASNYVESMPTTEYPISSSPMEAISTVPASYEMTEGCVGCGATEPASWGYDNGQIISGGVQGEVIGGSYGEQIVSSGQQVLGCASGDCGGQQVLGCASGDCGGQIVGGGQIIDSGQIVDGGQYASGGIVEGNVVYGGSSIESGEQIISSEIISETPISASDDTGTPEVTSPAESVPTEAPAGDSVPEAPEEDGKEA